MLPRLLPLGLALVAGLAACTPKAPTDATADAPAPAPAPSPAPEEDLSPCPKFSDAPNPDQASDNYVIYRDFLRTGSTREAYELWEQVYAVAPAADGKRNTVITDGIYFMELFASETTDTAEQRAYAERIFEFYDKIEECYPEGGYVPAAKAFDFFYKYPDMRSDEEIYALFKEAIRRDSMAVGDFILNPFSSLLVKLYEAGAIDDAEAQRYANFVLQRLDEGIAAAETDVERERYAIIEGYTPQRLAYFESVEGFYDCAYYKEKYLPEFEDARDDYVRLNQLAGYLRFGGCPDADADLTRLLAAAEEVKPEETKTGGGGGCFAMIKAENFGEAVDCLEESYAAADDAERKAQYALYIAKLYYGSLRNFPQARKWARTASQHRSSWGDPHLLVGKLYASSGPLCGSGTGFESQRVVWVAIDEWNTAKRLDPAVAAEANKLIGDYRQYMPSKDDGFMNGLAEGGSYTVDCWIDQATTVRY